MAVSKDDVSDFISTNNQHFMATFKQLLRETVGQSDLTRRNGKWGTKYGWNTVNEYKRHDLADNLDDEKLSISDVRGQGLFFGPLHEPLVLVRGSFWSRDNIFVALQFAKHWSRDAILVVPNQSDITWLVFRKPQGRKNVITWPEFFTKTNGPRSGSKKVLVTDVWDG